MPRPARSAVAFLAGPAPPPTVAEEVALTARVAAGDRGARDELIVRNVPLVISIAKRYRGRGVDFDDLISAGCTGLVRAADAYDAGRRTPGGTPPRFSTCASWWIRRAMQREFDGHLIHVPAHLCDDVRRWRRDGADPARLTPRMRAVVACRGRRVVRDDGHGGSLLGFLPDRAARDGPGMVDLGAALATLTAVERDVLCRRRGLDGREPEMAMDIARGYGKGRGWTFYIEQKAIGKLKEALTGVAMPRRVRWRKATAAVGVVV
jgi:RNA polymerase primary sigma factor